MKGGREGGRDREGRGRDEEREGGRERGEGGMKRGREGGHASTRALEVESRLIFLGHACI